ANRDVCFACPSATSKRPENTAPSTCTSAGLSSTSICERQPRHGIDGLTAPLTGHSFAPRVTSRFHNRPVSRELYRSRRVLRSLERFGSHFNANTPPQQVHADHERRPAT